MKPEIKSQLSQKGWKKEDIERTERILQSQHDRSRSVHRLQRTLYWFALLGLLICNLLVAVFLIPFLFVLKGVFLHIIIGTLGLIFGAFFNLLINDIEHLERRHHVFALVFIPVISIINIFIIYQLIHILAGIINYPLHQSPAIVSLVYVIAFIIPYTISMIKK